MMTRLTIALLAALLACLGTGPATAGVSAPAEPPAGPHVEWGPVVNGLRCSIALSQSDLRVGDPLVVEVKIRNVSDEPIAIPYVPGYFEGHRLTIETGRGDPVPPFTSGFTEGLLREPPFERINPGAIFTTSIKGRVTLEWANKSFLSPPQPDRPIVLSFGDVGFRLVSPGTFRIRFRLSSGDDAIAQGKRAGLTSVWRGSVESAAAGFRIRLRTREELDRAIEELRSGTDEQKALAVQVILANMDRQAVPALVEAMAAGVAGASEAVGALGDSSLVPRLMQMYREAGSDGQREAVLGALQMASRDVMDFFAEVAGSGPSELARRDAALRMADMARMREITAVHALLAVLKAPDPAPKLGAVDGLATLEDDLLRTMAVSGLVTAMESDADGGVRARAAGALGGIGDASVAPALVVALRDPDLWVGSYAAHSLGQLAGPDAIEPLRGYQKVAQTESQVQAATGAIAAIQQRSRSEDAK